MTTDVSMAQNHITLHWNCFQNLVLTYMTVAIISDNQTNTVLLIPQVHICGHLCVKQRNTVCMIQTFAEQLQRQRCMFIPCWPCSMTLYCTLTTKFSIYITIMKVRADEDTDV